MDAGPGKLFCPHDLEVEAACRAPHSIVEAVGVACQTGL